MSTHLRSALYSLILAATGLFLAIAPDYTPAPKPIAVTAPTPESMKAEMRREKLQVTYDMAETVAARVMRRNGCNDEYAEAVAHAAVDHRVPVKVLAAMAVVESTCSRDRISKTNDIGLLQINKKIWVEKKHRWTVKELLDPYINAQAGASILAANIHQYGLVEGIHAYNGFGSPEHPTDNGYALVVLARAGITPPASAV